MQTRYLLLVPVLVSVAGCSEKIEAQEYGSETGEIMVPHEQDEPMADLAGEQETDLKLHSPVGLD